MIDVPEWLLRQQKEKERLERTLPNNVIKGVPLPYLKKVGHILEIPRCGSLNKRQLIESIIDMQMEYQSVDRDYYDSILDFDTDGEVFHSLAVNKNCNFYPYIMNSKKYK